MRIRLAVGAVVAAFVGAGVAPAAPERESMQPVRHYLSKQKLTPGFFRGRTVRYLDFGPIKLAKGNRLAPIWVVTNGAAGQRNVIDVVPGQRGYSPLWQVKMVTFEQGVRAYVLRSAAAVRAAQRRGDVSIKSTSTVVNCPVVGFGQKQTIGHAKGQLIAYLDLGPVKLARGNRVAPIVTFTNGAAEQHNVIGVLPGDKGYTPLWSVEKATWTGQGSARVLRSLQAVRAAERRGELTIERTSTVVNCPVV